MNIICMHERLHDSQATTVTYLNDMLGEQVDYGTPVCVAMKSTSPLVRKRLVQRTRLLDALSAWQEYRVIRIVAPGGFGKSTLCSMWMSQLANLPDKHCLITVMLPISASDGTLDVFLYRLADALATVLPRLHDAAALAAAGELSVAQATRALLQAFATSQPIVLALDDLHLMPSGPVYELLQNLVNEASGQLHLVLLSRTHLHLDLSELLLDERVLTITMNDLAFDAEEFDAYTAMNRLQSLPAELLTQIRKRSGGWAAGLQLLVQSLPATHINSIDALQAAEAAPDLWKYVERAMFNHAGRQISFMVDTAILPWLEAELCATVTDLSPSECRNLLEEIAATNGLVTSTNVGGRYRVHSVLREILQRRLIAAYSPTRIDEMRRRAAEHLAGANEVDAALALLCEPTSDAAAGKPTLRQTDVQFAADLVERACRPALLRAEVVAVQRWLAQLPAQVIHARPQLAIDAAWCAFHMLGNQLQAMLARARESLQAYPHAEELDAEALALEILAVLNIPRNQEAYALLQHAFTLTISPEGLTAGYLCAIRGYLMYGEPRTLEERQRDIQTGYEIFTKNGFLRGRIEALVCDLWICTSYADVSNSIVSAERALQLIVDHGMEGGTFGIYAHLFAAQVLYYADRIDEARVHLERVAALTENTGASYGANVRLQLCALAASTIDAVDIDIDPVQDRVQYLKTAAVTAPIITIHTALMRILRDIRLGHPERCAASASIFGCTVEDLDDESSPVIGLAVLMAAVAGGRGDDVIADRISRLHTRAAHLHHNAVAMALQVLQVLVLQSNGSDDEAVTMLSELLREIERTHLTRLILDFKMPLAPLLRRVGTPFAEELLRRVAGTTNTIAYGLSDAELRVLRHLASRLNTPQIAEVMFISVNTVRTHVQNIYRKMHVHDREEAVLVAREAGLV
ncbi:MAG: LuxR C-terminal-related transcriptional regulator [Chloroflexi bacterium]|nr:LuxR C-terminal-related transcriptional regulator [Chloroflexota bacterium]